MLFSVLGGTILVGLIIVGLYILLIYPIMTVAIGNMAYYDGEFQATFRLDEILSLISQIG
jgi:multisubunit Na+/H+ antiporter MnhG subunit